MLIDGLEVDHCAPAQAGYAIIASPHPLYGGSLDNPVVEALADGFESAGLGTLRFNYRGIGRSEGQASGDVARASEDYARVLAWVRAQPKSHTGPLWLAGYSFGAIAALETALRDSATSMPRVSGLVLVAPPLGMLRADALARAPRPRFVLNGTSDDYAPIDAARAVYASVEDCRLTVIEADHFFVCELDAVADFARNALNP
jgi:alpha/beta superfamily hydrolase